MQYFQRRIPQLGKKVNLSIESPSPCRARINRELFEWVIENLTKNALDAIEGGEGSIAYTLTNHGSFTIIEVSDTGKGIDLKHRNDVFRPGFSTKKRGWGLGLSLSKRIVESYHGGKLTLKESKAGFKTTFRIKLLT
jgi:signal transduction histidine kinase